MTTDHGPLALEFFGGRADVASVARETPFAQFLLSNERIWLILREMHRDGLKVSTAGQYSREMLESAGVILKRRHRTFVVRTTFERDAIGAPWRVVKRSIAPWDAKLNRPAM